MSNLFILCLLILLGSTSAKAQLKEVDHTIYDWVETMPEFPEGERVLFKYIKSNLKFPSSEAACFISFSQTASSNKDTPQSPQ